MSITITEVKNMSDLGAAIMQLRDADSLFIFQDGVLRMATVASVRGTDMEPGLDTLNALGSAITNPVPVTPSDTIAFAPGLVGLTIICSVAGFVKVGFANGHSMTFPVAVGLNIFGPLGCNQVFVTGTTATAVYFANNP